MDKLVSFMPYRWSPSLIQICPPKLSLAWMTQLRNQITEKCFERASKHCTPISLRLWAGVEWDAKKPIIRQLLRKHNPRLVCIFCQSKFHFCGVLLFYTSKNRDLIHLKLIIMCIFVDAVHIMQQSLEIGMDLNFLTRKCVIFISSLSGFSVEKCVNFHIALSARMHFKKSLI